MTMRNALMPLMVEKSVNKRVEMKVHNTFVDSGKA